MHARSSSTGITLWHHRTSSTSWLLIWRRPSPQHRITYILFKAHPPLYAPQLSPMVAFHHQYHPYSFLAACDGESVSL
ncbi:hypothetical protein JB92DRAFT_2961224, partial [Gautieria morchelliformis]